MKTEIKSRCEIGKYGNVNEVDTMFRNCFTIKLNCKWSKLKEKTQLKIKFCILFQNEENIYKFNNIYPVRVSISYV